MFLLTISLLKEPVVALVKDARGHERVFYVAAYFCRGVYIHIQTWGLLKQIDFVADKQMRLPNMENTSTC